jgi:hypothetical protein
MGEPVLGQASGLWPEGRIPYLLDDRLGAADDVQEAVERWNSAGTPIRLLPAGAEPPADHVVFVPGAHCAAQIGRRGGRQEVTLTAGCRVGVVMHEIGHVLGLGHEHTRPDRDTYVVVRWQNVLPSAQYNFLRLADGDVSEGYDFTSIMHYSRMAFSRNRAETIVPTAAYEGVGLFGQRRQLSERDLARVSDLYPAGASAS